MKVLIALKYKCWRLADGLRKIEKNSKLCAAASEMEQKGAQKNINFMNYRK